MAGATLLTLLDDITTLLDDVAAMTKMAAQKTSAVVGDDLALNAKQVMGTPADRELPIVWAVAKGSFINKTILVPVALLLSVFLPVLVQPLLMLGGLYLCYEGAEKLLHGKKDAHVHSAIAPVETEKDKIKGAIRTDFILSAEIIIIVLGIVAAETLAVRITVLTLVGIGMTAIVYGLVAAIVKLDDFGLYLATKSGAIKTVGLGIVKAAPYLMRSLAVFGTAAMFIVGGQIIWHGIPFVHHALEHIATGIVGALVSAAVGLGSGFIVVGLEKAVRRVIGKSAAH